MRKIFGFILLFLFVLTVQKSKAQTPTPTPAAATVQSGIKERLAAGEVTSISQTDNKISLQTSDGAIDVLISSTTVFKRVPPENPNIAAAVASSITDIGEKDKLLVTGVVSADKKTIPAKTVYLMSKSDIAKRDQTEKEMWRTRGISGKVVSVDFKTQSVTISTPARGMAPATSVVLTPKENAQYLRYAADSVKYSDAVGSSLAEIKVGDELRALGDKGADGLSFKAERFITGSFKQVAGKVTAIDLEKNEITIEDSQSKKPVVISIKSTSILKKIDPQQAQMMAMMSSGGFQMQGGGQGNATFTMNRPPQGEQPKGEQPKGEQTGQKPAQGSNPAGNGQPNGSPMVIQMGGNGQPGGRPMGGGRGDLNDFFDRLPNTTISEIKVGDTIGLSTSPGNVPNRFTAIKLLSGIEPILAAQQRMAAMGGGRGGDGNQPSFNIPGLDGGIGNP